MSTSALASASDFLAKCDMSSVRYHAALTLGNSRKFGALAALLAPVRGKEEQEAQSSRDAGE